MKRRETKCGREDAVGRAGEVRAGRTLTPDEDRLSGLMPDPKHLSAVGRSALVRAGSRWLSFARGLSQGPRRRLPVADTLAFVESLYGGRYRAVEGGEFSLDKVYRMAGGGLFVSETRLSLIMHPRFDLRLLNVTHSHAGSQVFKGATATTALTLLSRAGTSDREQPRTALRGANSVVAARSLTVQTWRVSETGAANLPPAFGYVSVRGQRVQQAQGLESARPPARDEHLLRRDTATSQSVETSRLTVVSAPARFRPASLGHLRHSIHAPRQEFVSVILREHLPLVESREVLSVRRTGDLPGAPSRPTTVQVGTGRLFARAPGATVRQTPARTYAEPPRRRAQGGVVEVRREFHSTETLGEHATERDARPPMLHVLPPASLPLSMSEISKTLLSGIADSGGRTTSRASELAPALSLQLIRTHAQELGTRASAVAVRAPRLLDRTRQHQPSDRLEALSSLHTFVGRVHSTVTGVRHAGTSTVFAQPGFESALRHGFEQVSSGQRGGSRHVTPSHATARGLLVRTAGFVRHATVAESPRAASTRDTNILLSSERATNVFPTQSAPGSGTFLFASGLLRRAGGASAAGTLSPTAATALRLAVAAETEREATEARAARPEGMALELIRHRREEVLRLPSPGYVFTQPARSQLEERQVITKASREEIVEVVRKEVRLLAANAPTQSASTRAELAGLADEVYSTLVRRLLVEKERLGRI